MNRLTQDQEQIRARIVAAMGSRVSANALAKASGVDRRTIDRLKAGERFPGSDKIMAIARALDLELKGDLPDVLVTPAPAKHGESLTLSGFLAFVRSSGMELWASTAPPTEAPTLAEAMAAVALVTAEPQLSTSDGRPIDGWGSLFANLRKGHGAVPGNARPASSSAVKALVGDPTRTQDLTPEPASAKVTKKRSTLR